MPGFSFEINWMERQAGVRKTPNSRVLCCSEKTTQLIFYRIDEKFQISLAGFNQIFDEANVELKLRMPH